MVLCRLYQELLQAPALGRLVRPHCSLPRVQRMLRLCVLPEEVKLPDVEMSLYWLSWPMCAAIIKHYNLRSSYKTVYPHSSGVGVRSRDQ